MTYNYNTVSEAVNGLIARGYTIDFNIQLPSETIDCQNQQYRLSPDEFAIDEVHRFEGLTDPGDEMVLYAISSMDNFVKGTLLSAYGMYEDNVTSAVVQKLNRYIR